MINITNSEALISLFTSKDSPLYGMELFSFFDPGCILSMIFKWLGWALGRGLSEFLILMEGFAEYCYKFLSFSNNEIIAGEGGLYDVITSFIFVPLTICLIIIFVKFIMGTVNKGAGKQLISNFLVVVFVLVAMPSIFNFMNNTIIGTKYLDDVQSGVSIQEDDVVTSMSLANTILRDNTTDYLYLYNECENLQTSFQKSNGSDIDFLGEEGSQRYTGTTLSSLYSDLQTLKGKYSESEFSKDCNWDSLLFNVNQTLQNGEDGFVCPNIFQYKAVGITQSIENMSAETMADYKFYTLVKLNISGLFRIRDIT